MNILATARIASSRVITAAILVVVVLTASRWQVTSPVVGSLLYLAGIMLVTVATVGRLWCSLYISGYKNNELIRVGPYSATRNPLYFFSLVGLAGIGLATGSLVLTALLLAFFPLIYIPTIAMEEKKLAGIHGAAFADFVQKVPQFWPRWSQLDEPGTYECRPLVFRKRLLDTVWFVWAAGALKVAEALRDSGVIPTIWTLY